MCKIASKLYAIAWYIRPMEIVRPLPEVGHTAADHVIDMTETSGIFNAQHEL
jgi:hypothetical protein